jgi:hypothetical protein
MKLKILVILILNIFIMQKAIAQQILPTDIQKHTETIYATKTGEVGNTYFYCQNGNKCSTEQVVREYYKNKDYSVMRAEYAFWKGIFILTFLDELYPANHYTSYGKTGVFHDMALYKDKEADLVKKCDDIRNADLKEFINLQIKKHEAGAYIRDLDEWELEGYKNPTEYFKSPIVQYFLTKIDNKTFYKVVNRILQDRKNNTVGTPDYIVWKNNELIFVEVKRKNEKLSEDQIGWGEFLIKNKISYRIIRVEGQKLPTFYVKP